MNHSARNATHNIYIYICIYLYIHRDYDRPLSGFLFTKHDFRKNKGRFLLVALMTGIFNPKKASVMMENTPIPEVELD